MGFLKSFLSKNSFALTCYTLGAGAFVKFYGKHSFLAHYYAANLKKYENNGEPVPINAVLKYRLQAILKDLDFGEWMNERITIFIGKYSLDPEFIGSTQIRQGVWYAIPEYFQCNSDIALKNCGILIDNKPVKWDSPDGNKFLQSLKFDEQTQKFVMARDIAMADTYYVTMDSCLPSFMIVGYHNMCSLLYSKLNMLHRPFWFTVSLYTVLAIGSVFVYMLMNDGLYLVYSQNMEDKICEMKGSYILGGLQYYTKIIERNKALRSLMKNGEKFYSADGNENIRFWRASGLPNTLKLKLMEQRLDIQTELDDLKTVISANPNPHPIY